MDNFPFLDYKDSWDPNYKEPEKLPNPKWFIPAVILMVILFWVAFAHAEEVKLMASFYSEASLKKEGTWKHGEQLMSNGHRFKDSEMTCASWMYKLGTVLKITNLNNQKYVIVRVTDRCARRFSQTRIDLSKGAFLQIADLRKGLVPIEVEIIHD